MALTLATSASANWRREKPLAPKPRSVESLHHPNKEAEKLASASAPDAVVAVSPSTFGSEPVAMATLGVASSPEFTNLARGLLNSPQRIYEFVRNNIAYEHYYGSKKGALMTLLDGSGNDSDQCVLLAELLNAAGYAPTFRQATQIVPYGDGSGNDFVAWTGVAAIAFPGLTWIESYQAAGFASDPLPGFPWPDQVKKNYLLAQGFTANRGWPQGTFGYANNGNSFGLERIWVSIVIDGVTYHLDPSFKRTTRAEPFPLAAGSGYDRAALLAAAAGNTPNGYTVSGLSETGISGKLAEFTSNLVGAIKAGATPHLSVEEFLGRQQIVQVDVTALSTAPALQVASTTFLYSEFPADMLTLVNFTLAPGRPYEVETTFPMAGLGGKRLALTFSGDVVQLWLDDAVLLTTSTPESGVNLGTGVAYPYGFVDSNTVTYRKGDGFAYAVVYGFSPSGLHVRQRQHQLDEAVRQARVLPGVTFDASGNLNFASIPDAGLRRRCITETLNVIGLSWFHHTRLNELLIADLSRVDALVDHRIGRVGQEEGFFIDISQVHSSTRPLTGVEADATLVFELAGYFGSAHEHGILERMQPGNGSLSTIKILSLANQSAGDVNRDETFLVNSGSIADVRPLLKGYAPSFLNFLETSVATGSRFLLPENAAYTLGSWTGFGYVEASPGLIAMMISGGLNGGYNSEPGGVADSLRGYFRSSPNWFDLGEGFSLLDPNSPSYDLIKPRSYDPVDMSSGAFVLDRDDLAVGEGSPRGLRLVRSYNSHWRGNNAVGLGWGWTHNYDMRATVRSAPEVALGESTPFDMAASLVAVYAAVDIYKSASTAKEWALSALMANWAVNNLKNNAVALGLGKESVQFIKQPDGTFQPPAQSTLTLTGEVSGDYVVQERLGHSYRFSMAEGLRIKTITDIDGKAMTFNYNGAQLSSVADAFGRNLTFTHAGGRLVSVTDSTTPARTVYYGSSDPDGNLTSFTDPEGKTGTMTYTDRRVTETRDADGRVVVQNFYDSDGRVERQRNQGLAEREWKLYWSGFRNAEENPLGQQTTYFFDRRARALGMMNGKGERSRLTFDGQNHIIEQRTPKNEVTSLVYDANHNLVRITDPLSAVTLRTYDSLHRLTRVDLIDPNYPDASNPSAVDRSHAIYFDPGNITNRPDRVVDPRNAETRFAYEPQSGAAAGKPATITRVSAEGNRLTSFTYDLRGMLQRMDTPNPAGGTFQESFVFNPRGDLESYTDKRGVTVASTFNARRERVSSTGPGDGSDYANAITKWIYNNNGEVEFVVDPMGRAIRSIYSATAKLLSVQTGLLETGPGSFDSSQAITASTNAYDIRDWIQSSTGPVSGQVTQITYDAAGRALALTDAESRTVTNGYDANGQQTSTTDNVAVGITRSVQNNFDARGYPASFTDAAGDPITYSANAWGERTSLTNRRGQTFLFTYEANGLLKSQVTPLGREQLNTYNDRNLPLSSRQPSGRLTTYAYDAADRLASFTDPVGTVQFGYDANGNPLTITEGAAVLARTFDPYNRVKTHTDARGRQIGYTYHANGLLKSLTYPGNRTVTHSYDTRNRLTGMQDWAGRITSFVWRADGLLSRIVRPNLSTRELFYDRVGQLLKVEERNPLGELNTFRGYQYDLGGRIVSRFALPLPQTAPVPLADMTYDADNRLATYGGAPCVSDSDGNLTSGPLPGGPMGTYTYDARNRLVSSAGVSYGYDALNNRVSMTQGGQTTHYVVDPHGGPLPGVAIREKPDGTRTFYVHGAGILLYEESIPPGAPSGSVAYYHYDNIGNTVALSNGAGAIVDRVEYSPYGTITFRFANFDTPFLYVGALGVQTDPNGLHFMRARYYNSRTGRFLNADPIGFAGGMNWYAYVNGNPISSVDPSGFAGEAPNNAGSSIYDKVSTGIHVGLGGAGAFPVLGIVPDVIDLVYTVGELPFGKSTGVDVTLGVVGIVATVTPFSGDIAAAAAKIANRIKKAAENGIQFGQATVKSTFAHGPHAGKTIGEVAAGLRSGAISPNSLPVEYIVRNGQAVALNNRSLLALERAGLEPTITRNLTGNQAAEALLNSHLRGGAPSNVIRVRGGPAGTSPIE